MWFQASSVLLLCLIHQSLDGLIISLPLLHLRAAVFWRSLVFLHSSSMTISSFLFCDETRTGTFSDCSRHTDRHRFLLFCFCSTHQIECFFVYQCDSMIRFFHPGSFSCRIFVAEAWGVLCASRQMVTSVRSLYDAFSPSPLFTLSLLHEDAQYRCMNVTLHFPPCRRILLQCLQRVVRNDGH